MFGGCVGGGQRGGRGGGGGEGGGGRGGGREGEREGEEGRGRKDKEGGGERRGRERGESGGRTEGSWGEGGEEGKIFGSVRKKDIEEDREKKGEKIDKKKRMRAEAIKAVGEYDVAIKLGYDVTGTIKVKVVAKA